MKDKLIAISCSPRKGGNTDILLDNAISGAKSRRGISIEKFYLNDLKITPCQHCDGCLNTGECIIDDDMQIIYKKLKELDYFILSSPIFFMHLTAQAKSMIDRCQCLWVRKNYLRKSINESNKNRKGVFISVGGTKYQNLFECAERTVKAFFNVIEVSFLNGLYFFEINNKSEIKNYPLALKKAFNLGNILVMKNE